MKPKEIEERKRQIRRRNNYLKSKRKYELAVSIYDERGKFSQRYSKHSFSCDCGTCRYARYWSKIERNKRFEQVYIDRENDYILELNQGLAS